MIHLSTTQLAPEPSPEDLLTLQTRVQATLDRLGAGVSIERLRLVGGTWWADLDGGNTRRRVADLIDEARARIK